MWTLKRTYLIPLYALEHLFLLYEEKLSNEQTTAEQELQQPQK